MLSWIADRRRTYPETMEAWRSTCPRLTIWEDAVSDGLVRVAGKDVLLTERGRTVLGDGDLPA